MALDAVAISPHDYAHPGYRYAFTVFTATYNRAQTLRRVYDSLKAQTYRDFEWLIVDDGSTDNTKQIVEGWQREANFPIRYLQQQNRGKHTALNCGVAEAQGQLFIALDSDDECIPEALERFLCHWIAIPPERREGFSAVTALCVDQHGKLVGNPYPEDIFDSNTMDLRYIHKVHGEKWGFQRTDVMRQYPFPEDVINTCLPEGIVWDKISTKYQTRFVNEKLRIYYVDTLSLSNVDKPGRHGLGTRESYLNDLNNHMHYLRHAPISLLRSAALYVRFSLHAGFGARQQQRRLTNLPARILWAMAAPVGLFVYLKDPK